MRRLLATIAISAIGSSFALPAIARDSIPGDRIYILVGFAPGGGINTMARMFAHHFAKHLPVSKTIVIQNMPGAAGMIAMNRLAKVSPKDGTVIAYDTWAPLNQVIQSKSIQFDYTKMTMIGALRGGPLVMFARTDIVPGGMKSAADIVNAKSIIYAGQQPTLVLDIHGRVALDLMQLKYKYISGYKGPPNIRTAMEQGEANVTTHGLQGYKSGVEPNFVKKGIFAPLWYFQGRDPDGRWVIDKRMGAMPTLIETYAKIHGSQPTGFQLQVLELLADLYRNASEFVWAPPGLAPDAAALLRTAFYTTTTDPAFLADQDKILGFRYQGVQLEDANAIVQKLNNVNPALAAYFKKVMQ